MNQRIQNLFIFCWGGMLYGLVELFWRGNTHWTMVVTGGICFLLLDRLDRTTAGEPAAVRCIKGAILITGVELVAGLIINRVMCLDVWDYSYLPYNFAGQICPLYTIYWYFLCYPAFWLLRGLRGKSYKNPDGKGIAKGNQTVYNRGKISVKTPMPGVTPGQKENA